VTSTASVMQISTWIQPASFGATSLVFVQSFETVASAIILPMDTSMDIYGIIQYRVA
jgi:hypothetical protein